MTKLEHALRSIAENGEPPIPYNFHKKLRWLIEGLGGAKQAAEFIDDFEKSEYDNTKPLSPEVSGQTLEKNEY